MKRILILFFGLFLTCSLSAQQRVIFGKVNVFKNLTLANIVVSAKKSGSKTLTDSLGNYYIVCNQKDVLEFSGKTFYKVRIRVKPTDDSINVNMKFIDKPENVEMAIGYGYITKDKATTAVSALVNSRDNFCSYQNIYDLIAAKCAGVNVSSQSIFPGQEQDVSMRGVTSINKTSALFVVDGVMTSQIANIDPCDVGKISFLKDVDAAIYGSVGGGGVIIIETVKATDLK